MSADNYVIVRKFGDGNFGWANFYASVEGEDQEGANWHKGFKTPREAARDAHEVEYIIEYGIQFEVGCLIGE